MKKPDTVIANYIFLVFVAFLIFFIFSLMMWILNLSGKCSYNAKKEEKKEKKEKKKNNTIIYLIIFVVICSMAAQAVNQSYQRIIPKVTTK
jgi:hypothetical protein